MSSQQTIAHYRIVSKLGEGGMGAVYRATDTKLGREVAIKVLPEAFARDAGRMARFEREAQVLASLNHPNIAAIYGIEEGALVMELVEGANLKGPLPVQTAVQYARQIASALEAAHEKGIVHRDLKPANIKVTPDGVVKVLDFGLAKTTDDASAAGSSATISPTLSLAMTQAGMILGTAAYMSPEQARGKPVDKRADIWSFGVVFFEMLTGTMLFGGGETVSDSLAAVITKEPEWNALPKDTPTNVRRLIERCLRKDPKRRLRDIGEARIALEEPVAEAAPAAAPASSRGVSRWWLAVTAVFGLAALALAFVHFREKPPTANVVRFQVGPPENGSISSASPNSGIALSPDGHYMAFAAFVGDRSSLWVRALDTLELRELPGTESGGSPFWSPDGQYLGFFVAGKLKKVALAGGPAITLCEVAATLIGGTWNREGVILFGRNADGIMRVPQAGGDPVFQTRPDPSRQETFHSRPWFLPDGRHFLYLARGNQTASQGVFLATLDGKERKFLAASQTAPAYAAPANSSEKGHLLFLREATLMAQPLDPATYAPAGDPFPVAEHVGSAISNAYFSVSLNGALAYRASGLAADSRAEWFDRSGKSQGRLDPSADGDRDLALSPDGKRVAVTRLDGRSGFSDIWIVDLERHVPTRFTFAQGARRPVWSPDGKFLLYSAGQSQIVTTQDLYLKDTTGGKEQLLLKTGSVTDPWDWSADGRFVLYGEGFGGASGFWQLPMEGERKAVQVVTGGQPRQAQFSPNPGGSPRWIAYTSGESGRYEVYVHAFPFDSGAKFQISTGGGSQPRWRQDGKELYFITPDNRLMAVEVSLAPRFEHGLPKALFTANVWGGGGNAPMSGEMYSPSPDGKRFLIASQDIEATPVPITVVLNWRSGLKH